MAITHVALDDSKRVIVAGILRAEAQGIGGHLDLLANAGRVREAVRDRVSVFEAA